MSALNEVKAIKDEIVKLQARAALLITEGRAEAIDSIKSMMAEYTISAADLGLTLKPAPRGPRAAKYRDPVSGATWTGQGHAPSWIVGKERNEFLISKENT